MKNKKEIDMIVGVLNRYAQIKDYGKEVVESIAYSILTKVKEKEIVVLEGKWTGYSGQLSKYLGKNIILKAVMKDE